MNRCFGRAVTLAISLAAQIQTLQAESPGLRPGDSLLVTLALCDKTGVDAAILRAAEAHVERVLEAVGIAVEWVESAGVHTRATFIANSFEQCQFPERESDFIVVIAPNAPEDWSSAILGFAQRDARPLERAYILHDRVSAFVAEHDADTGVTLGHVMAHELGHLLMPGVGHSVNGLMSAAWGEREGGEASRGMLLFDRVQAERIQARVRTLH